MKNAAEKNDDELRPEYDLSRLKGAVQGKYYKRATAGNTLVLLEPDVAEAFPDGRTVNDVLRAVVKVARTQKVSKLRRTPTADKKPSSRRR